ncbi:transposase [Blastopirellula sp. J2-11]|nr:transposase [Blastopirellula sp. J2-11]
MRRTWAPQGATPVMRNWDRHDRVTALAALCWTPINCRVQLHFQLLNHNATAEDFVEFLQMLHQQLQRKLIIVWDRLGAHRKAARAFRTLKIPWAKFEWLPPYCPELNPVEHVWSTTKWGRLCNWPAEDIYDLAGGVHEDFDAQAASEDLLRSHFRSAGLVLNCLRRRQ